jgi:hypothetical protein
MSQGKRRTPEQIINCIRKVAVLLSQEFSIPDHNFIPLAIAHELLPCSHAAR